MIIVLFHALYLFGKYVYENFRHHKFKSEDIMGTNQLLNVTESDYDFSQYDEDVKDYKIKFFPPVYIQRYTTVQNVLASAEYHGKIRKVIDFGCAELSFAIHLKNTDGIQEIICVDVDRSVLENCQTKVEPLHCDYISLRTEPLKIHVCEGSVAHTASEFANADAVICIELIEHLYPADLEAFPYNVFGFIKPLVAIVTTPNADFNVLFKQLRGFRHTDHKFEWTRKQFQDWANNIVLRYPDYEVTFHGIGSGPPGTEQFGSCSQMAVFNRHSDLCIEKVAGIDGLLKTVVLHDYPFRADNRSDEEKILDEVTYYIRLYSSSSEELSEEIPLEKLMFSVEKFHVSIEILRNVLEEANWAVEDRENGPVVLVPAQSGFSSNSAVDFDDFLDADYRLHDTENDWDTLESGPADYLYDGYIQRDIQNYEQEENWDDEPDTYYSGNLNLNSDNMTSSELNLSENLGHTSGSPWGMEDLNNEDQSLDVSQNQPRITSVDIASEPELHNDCLSIRSDHTDVNNLNISSNTFDSLEQNSSSLLPISDLSETSQFFNTDSSHLLSKSTNFTLSNCHLEGSSKSEASKTDTCVECKENSNIDGGRKICIGHVSNSTQHEETENKGNAKFHTCSYPAVTESNDIRDTLEADIHSLPEHGRIAIKLYSNSEPVYDTDCCLLSNKTSSISTEEATLLLSREETLLEDDKYLLQSNQGSLRNEQFLNNDRGSSNLQPSCIDNDSSHERSEVSYPNTMDLSSVTIGSCKYLNGAYDGTNSSNQKYGDDLIDEVKVESKVTKSQDSLSFKSMSDCSLDLQPKYTSSPQISIDTCKVLAETNENSRLLNESSSHNQKCIAVFENDPKSEITDSQNTYQSNVKKQKSKELEIHASNLEINLLHINDSSSKDHFSTKDETSLYKEDLSKDVKIIEKESILSSPELKIIENLSPTTSQLSLQSNSDVSLSTATSTGSSNVEKWYVTETNPMYQQDIVMLKGGNDTADNPNGEITSDSDTTVSSSGFFQEKNQENSSAQSEDTISMPNECKMVEEKASLILIPAYAEIKPKLHKEVVAIEIETILEKVFDTVDGGPISSIAIKDSKIKESIASKPLSPESLDTSPNSWSPEIMDSGYPNSASVHDITPEYELSSIANDRTSDSDSASIGEVPVPGFYEFVEVENGDLANNNRDNEGNNVVAFEANDLDDLQPLIDVLENDMENENDIYVLQNGFPIWLLRILEMANPIELEGIRAPQAQLYPPLPEQAGGDAQNLNAENDEGFDSSSSDDDTDIGDDESGDATTISSDETEDRSSENLRGDWRAGGDP